MLDDFLGSKSLSKHSNAVFRTPVPSFGRLKALSETEGAQSQSLLSHRSSSPSLAYAIRNIGQEPSFLDISAGDGNVSVATCEYNNNRYYLCLLRSWSPHLSTISSEVFAVGGLGNLPSPSSAVLSGMDIRTQYRFSGGGALLFAVVYFPRPPRHLNQVLGYLPSTVRLAKKQCPSSCILTYSSPDPQELL